MSSPTDDDFGLIIKARVKFSYKKCKEKISVMYPNPEIEDIFDMVRKAYLYGYLDGFQFAKSNFRKKADTPP